MATMTLSTPIFYKSGKAGASAVVGYEGGDNRVARYSFTSSGSGASHVDVVFRGMSYGGGDTGNIPLAFYIGTDPGSHAGAGAGSPATGSLSCKANADYTFAYSGAADVVLLPNTTYYLWVFPSSTTYGWWYWKNTAEFASLDGSGGAYSTISGQNGTLGSENTLRIKRYSAQMNHTVTAACGTASMTIGTGLQVDSVTWTPPLEWAAQNVNAVSVVVSVTCITYNGSTEIGRSSTTLTFQIPESVVPTASLTVSDAKGYLGQYGAYIQNNSQARVEGAGSGIYGSTITRYSIQCGSVSADKQTATFGLTASGKVTITVRVTDSRGRSASSSTEINVTAYAAPSAGISALYRCDETGNEEFLGAYANAVFSARVTALDGKNSASYALQYRVRGTTSWTRIELSDLTGSYAPEQASQIFPASIDSSYEACIAVTDNFATISCAYRTVQVAKALMDFDRANWAIAFGQRAVEANTAAFGILAKFNAGADLAGGRITGMGMPTSGEDGASAAFANSRVARNLLDNSDFTNPVNQRGQTKYAQSGCTVDRWKTPTLNLSVNVAADSVSLANAGTASAAFHQFVNPDAIKAGSTYTLAVCLRDGGIYCLAAEAMRANGNSAIRSLPDGSLQLSKNDSGYRFNVNVNGGKTIYLRWAALYEGAFTAETLPPYVPKGYGVELVECQRYYNELSSPASLYDVILNGMLTNAKKDIVVATPVRTMRTDNPTCTFTGFIVIRDPSGYVENSGSSEIPVNIAVSGGKPNGYITLVIRKTDGTAFSAAVNNVPCQVNFKKGAKLSISADL